MHSRQPTTIRLDTQLKKTITRLAKEKGITFSQAVSLALKALADGTFFLSVGVSEYSDSYASALEKESKKTMALYKQGRKKGYTSGKKMVEDILYPS